MMAGFGIRQSSGFECMYVPAFCQMMYVNLQHRQVELIATTEKTTRRKLVRESQQGESVNEREVT